MFPEPMAFDREALSDEQRRMVQARILFALAVALWGVAGVSWAGVDLVTGQLRRAFGSGTRDRAIEAAPMTAEATLMSVDAVGPGRMIVSYEYYAGVEMYVGYAGVPADATLAWKRLGPLDIEHAADRPEWSRPAGVVLAPRGWITDRWVEWGPWLPLVPAVAGLGLVAVGLSLRRR